MFVACRHAGIPRTVFYRWRKSDEEFRKEIEKVNAENVDKIMDALQRTGT